MKIQITTTIVLIATVDTSLPEYCYINPEDVESCVAEEQNWLDQGHVTIEDLDFTDAIVTVTGKEIDNETV